MNVRDTTNPLLVIMVSGQTCELPIEYKSCTYLVTLAAGKWWLIRHGVCQVPTCDVGGDHRMAVHSHLQDCGAHLSDTIGHLMQRGWLPGEACGACWRSVGDAASHGRCGRAQDGSVHA